MTVRYTRAVTPVGIAQYPWLSTADTKFYDMGEYKCNLIVSKDEAAELIAAYEEELSTHAKKQKAKSKHSSIVEELDDQGNATGNVIIKTKNKNKMVNGSIWDRKPALFDAEGQPLTADVGGGSKLKLAVEFFPACVNGKQYLSIQIRGVQVHDLVEYGSDDMFGDSGEASVQGVGKASEDDDLF